MSKDLTPPSPERFGLASFADLLPARDPIFGEDPGSFAGFHDGMIGQLTPFTPYECVIAENLIAIEWELLQHRRMRDAGLRNAIRWEIRRAATERERKKHVARLNAAWREFNRAGGDKDAWADPFEFDEAAAEEMAEDLAVRAVSPDRDVQAKACDELVELGFTPVDLMSRAYSDIYGLAYGHDAKMQELERRRREVKRDFDALRSARPVEAEVVEG
jgi:hypothetical protein